ncbi:MAG: alpha/beta hydrolase [Bacteroidales bacterium]|nr:alpha/beta hydrolase [Bacteroidales bacterium]
MKKTVYAKSIVIFTFLLLVTLGFAQKDTAFIFGHWRGELQNLEIVFNILQENDTVLVTLDSPDQGAYDIQVNYFSFEDNELVLYADLIGGHYIGQYNSDTKVIEGTWYQSGYELSLVLKKTLEKSAFNRPQEPQPPFPYIADNVSFPSTESDVILAGTLTLPEGNGPFPAVILITGSGLQNRDEEIMGHKPFLVIADYLTRKGVAVLRYDDRGYGESTGDFMTATTNNFANDAMGAFNFLSKDTRIDHNNIGIIGHSEGAMIAPVLAADNPSISFIVMLAGSGLSGQETLLLQSEKLLTKSGENQEYIQQVLDLNKKIYTIVCNEPDDEIAANKIKKAYSKFTSKMSEEEKKRRGFNEYVIEAGMKDMLNPWMRYFLSFDIKPYLIKTHCPVLILNGDKDIQVPPRENIPPIESALQKGGNTDYDVVVMPGLNHLFQTAGTGYPDEYARIEETFSPEALEIISQWIMVVVEGE